MESEPMKCVIFDCEGTLVDSEKLCCQALVSVFNCYGAQLSMDEALSHFNGGKLADILVETSQRLGVKVDIDELEPLYREKTRVLFQDQLRPCKNAVKVLDMLKQHGIEVCVVSNGPRSKLEYTLEISGLSDYFKGAMFSAFDANSWKPEPDLIQYAAMRMGFRAKECLFVDDTLQGIRAGVAANITTLHYRPNPLSPKWSAEGAMSISDLSEVLEYCADVPPLEYHI
ncbi:HAD family hydrolase [Vibrio breoganii]|nr:HAD family hydrolase [Vibrio breoganii 1C10]PMG96369.1 HAD family hydrolase [Vibrio breoganii]PMK20891.1 HAD family hydrolase [Vibrio breoganii]PMM84310.1 HAD family hydrolase [Vibrio breoganii]PMO64865.1 HAD family hydrolase [Vibrio breoganii]